MHDKLQEWLPFLCCPLCRGELELQREALYCCACERAYPIIDGIPDLVPPERED